jgi:hypothetical protein
VTAQAASPEFSRPRSPSLIRTSPKRNSKSGTEKSPMMAELKPESLSKIRDSADQLAALHEVAEQCTDLIFLDSTVRALTSTVTMYIHTLAADLLPSLPLIRRRRLYTAADSPPSLFRSRRT